MDELSEKIASLLNDPKSMEQVKQMAENILSNSDKEDKNNDDISQFLGAGEFQAIINIIKKFKASNDNPRSQLLLALKPHLSEPKREKVDTAIKLLKIIELLPFLKESGILNI